MPKCLIAGIPSIYDNYERTLSSLGFSVVYPPKPPGDAPYILSQLGDISFDILLLPGGGDISSLLYEKTEDKNHIPDYITDLLQFQLLQLALFKQKPVLGICKGMQLLNVYFGGSLYTHLPTAGDHCSPDCDIMHPLSFAPYFPEKCRIFGTSYAAGSLHAILSEHPMVNSAHRQGIRSPGHDLITLQYSGDYLPETIAHRQLAILGLQWHPERLENFRKNAFGNLIHLLLQSAQLCYTNN